METQLVDRGATFSMIGNRTLRDDPMVGFETAAKNNQPQMALSYAVMVIKNLQERIERLETLLPQEKEAEVSDEGGEEAPEASTAPARKVRSSGKKPAPAPQPEPEQPVEEDV